MLRIYSFLMTLAAPLLRLLLRRRCSRGKEDPARLGERMGIPGLPRPDGRLVWLHAASVGEAQSALTLIDALLRRYPALTALVTTGTVTSAELMKTRLPPRAIHQFVPLDRPQWVARFLDHWRPDAVLWMESELWPNTLTALHGRGIPAALVNARLSPRSFRRWRLAKKTITALLSTFSVILTQTQDDARLYRDLGAQDVVVTDNLKYSAAPLPHDEAERARLQTAVAGRPLWLFASTHADEEAMACRVHKALEKEFSGLLTIIAPRHPDRRHDIAAACTREGLTIAVRGAGKTPPAPADKIYVADTFGELGLFYRLSPVACIGRSFSADGGGGHNPIEAAQLGCAVLHGPLVQNLAEIYSEMDAAGAAKPATDEARLRDAIADLLHDHAACTELQNRGRRFAQDKAAVLDRVIAGLAPVLAALDGTRKPQAVQKCA